MIAGLLRLDNGASDFDLSERMGTVGQQSSAETLGGYRSPSGRATLASRHLGTVGQPLTNETQDIWMVLDGEILNYRALRHSLELVGHRFRSGSDAEAALHAYEQWDLGFLSHVQGAFALALWDDRHDRLVLARDRLGRKPLFVAESGGQLGFASSIAPLLEEMSLPRRVNREALSQYMTFGVIPAPASLVAGVNKLAPGEMMVVERGCAPQRRLWGASPLEGRQSGSLRNLSPERHWGNLRTLLECSIADRLNGGTPVGVWMTGAPGSTAIASLINRLAGRPPRALGLVADVGSAEDLRLASQCAGVELQDIPVGPEHVIAMISRFVQSLPEPTPEPLLVAAWFAAQGAKGVPLMADCGMEEVMLCHAAYDEARRPGILRRLEQWLPKSRKSEGVNPTRGAPPLSLRPFAEPWAMKGVFADGTFLPVGAIPPLSQGMPRWLVRDRLAAFGVHDLRLRIADGFAPAFDALTQSHGAKARLPFLDDALVGYALALPSALRSPSRAPRRALQRVLEGLLPAALVMRPRALSPLPLADWLAGPLSAEVERRLLASSLLDPAAVRDLMTQHRATRGATRAIWALLILVEWCAVLRLDLPAPSRSRGEMPAHGEV